MTRLEYGHLEYVDRGLACVMAAWALGIAVNWRRCGKLDGSASFVGMGLKFKDLVPG